MSGWGRCLAGQEALGCRIREDVLPGEVRMVTNSKDADARLTQRLTTAVFAVCHPTGVTEKTLLHGSLTYRDKRLSGFDAAVAMEVIEHIDAPRLDAFEEVVFGSAKPGAVLITTPNAEYNTLFGGLPAGEFRHRDHRFEWTRGQFQIWARQAAERRKYDVRFQDIGPEHPDYGAPTQMGIFTQ